MSEYDLQAGWSQPGIGIPRNCERIWLTSWNRIKAWSAFPSANGETAGWLGRLGQARGRVRGRVKASEEVPLDDAGHPGVRMGSAEELAPPEVSQLVVG